MSDDLTVMSRIAAHGGCRQSTWGTSRADSPPQRITADSPASRGATPDVAIHPTHKVPEPRHLSSSPNALPAAMPDSGRLRFATSSVLVSEINAVNQFGPRRFGGGYRLTERCWLERLTAAPRERGAGTHAPEPASDPPQAVGQTRCRGEVDGTASPRPPPPQRAEGHSRLGLQQLQHLRTGRAGPIRSHRALPSKFNA